MSTVSLCTIRGGRLLPGDCNYTEDEHGFNWNYQIRPRQRTPLEQYKAANVNMHGDDDDG